MQNLNPAVDDVGMHTGAGADVWKRVSLIVRQVALVDAIDPPHGCVLNRGRGNDAVLFDVLDHRIAAERDCGLLRHRDRKSFQRVLENETRVARMLREQLVDRRLDLLGTSIVPEHDDVLPGDRFLRSAKLVVGRVTLWLRRTRRTAAEQ